MDFDVPLPDGRPSPMHLMSVANFLEPRVQDKWWTTEHVQMYWEPSTAKFRIGESKIAGCGAMAKYPIKKGEKIGIVWVKDPLSLKGGMFADLIPRHFTPWYGRAVNHCHEHPTSGLWEDPADGSVWSVAKK